MSKANSIIPTNLVFDLSIPKLAGESEKGAYFVIRTFGNELLTKLSKAHETILFLSHNSDTKLCQVDTTLVSQSRTTTIVALESTILYHCDTKLYQQMIQ